MRGRSRAGGRAGRFLALAALSVASCGRVGFDLLPASGERSEGGAGLTDGSVGTGGGPDDGGAGAGGKANGAGGLGSGGIGGAGAGGIAPNGGAGGAGGTGGAPDAGPPRCPDPVKPNPDPCARVSRLPASPTFDGLLDCGLEAHPIPTTNSLGDVQGSSASYAVAWRPDGLYFYVEVKTSRVVPAASADPVDLGDAVELFADADGTFPPPPPPHYDATGTRRLVISAPENRVASRAQGEIDAHLQVGFPKPWLSTLFRAFPTNDGYVVEAFVVGADLGVSPWLLSAGNEIGFDVGVDVSSEGADAGTDGGRPGGRYFVSFAGAGHTVDDAPDVNPEAFCKPTLDP
ncbi:MAG TPA: hypothetical protein VHE30_05895 [Polyangiaceae bacterium]|nr:hypothetical protein [Polyangiaceae bacterium]